ncbi:unnamed protein product [Leptidea sinapis]|uniref:Serpentine receptor class gamma n=1 Tax=Leptidea sinapis TaxID=189913 RepID=A0A5E4Q708_9NEOP|nr:unnamed protein product [Leptidea sinapis]
MSTQFKAMPSLELKLYIRIVAVVFSISSATAFGFSLLRLLDPELFYTVELDNTGIGNVHKFNLVIHYIICGMMIVTSAIGFLNSLIVMNRSSSKNTGRNITVWLLLDSLFETTRVVYVFLCEIMLQGKGQLQFWELVISIGQYLLDSFLYCQMILRH